MSLLCPDSQPIFLQLFDPRIAPPLLFYSYIPIIVISLFFGFYVLIKDSFSLQSKLLLFISISFSFFLLNEIDQWIAAPVSVAFLGWILAPLFQLFVWLSSIYFFYSFLYRKLLPLKYSVMLAIFYMPIILLLPTRLNFIRFELDVCEGRIGPLWYYLYSFQFLSILMLIIMGAIKFKSEKKDLNFRKQVLILTVAISFFLLIFLISNLSGELLKDFGEIFVTYQINLVGPLGMVLFLALLTYLIVEYKVFNIKLITAQALIVSLIILVASLFSFNQSSYEKVIICVTLLLTMGIGWALVRSVKLEIQRKEQLQDMTDKLAVANEQLRKLDNAKSEFISIASHQLRTPLTAVKGYGSLLLEGSYGKMSEKQKDVLNKMYQSNERLITLVEDILNLSRIESGRMEYKFESVKIEEVLQEIFDTFILKAKERKLSLELVKSEKSLPEVKTDRNKIREIISNFTDNAIKYTPEGGVKMKAYEQDGKVVVAISDTGIGIPQEEIPYLFEKFSRGKNISRLNAGGTGLGLHVGIKMIQELKGRIRVESEGAGKGSTFFVELPTE